MENTPNGRVSKKVCSCCKQEKDLCYFHKNKSQKDGYSHECKLCRSRRSKESANKNKHSKREYNQKYYLANKDKIKEKAKEYYLSNKEDVLEKTYVYYYNNREKIIEYKTEYRKANKDKIVEYRRNSKHKSAAMSAKRRARKALRTPKWLTKEDFLKIEDLYEEARRLTHDTGILHHVDHIVPLKGDGVSGLHVPYNLQILTYKDNLQKSNKLIESYL